MGQKVNPHGLRVGIVKDWDAKWYADKDFAANLHEDVKIRNFLKETLFIAGISRIEIERTNKRIKLTIHTAKPGMVIGRGGAGIEDIKKAMTRFTDNKWTLTSQKLNKQTWMQSWLQKTLLANWNAVLVSVVQ